MISYLLHVLIMASLNLTPVLGFNLVFGRGKILHFGQVAFSVVAAYGIYTSVYYLHSFSLGIVIGTLCTFILALLFAWMALRLESDALGILTIAMHLAVIAVVLNWTSFTRGALGLPQLPRILDLQSLGGFAVMSITIAALYFFFILRVDHSKLGRSLTALAENRAHAEALGISRPKTYVLVFLCAGLGSLLSAFLYPQYVSLLHPNDYFFPSFVFFATCVVAGGPGRVLGVTISTVLLVFLQEGLRFIPFPLGFLGPMRLILFGGILLVAVYLRRKELFPMMRTV